MQRSLLRLLPDDCIEKGHELDALHLLPDLSEGVDATFRLRGTGAGDEGIVTYRCRVLVGADGLASRTKACLGPAASEPPLTDAGQVLWRAMCRYDDVSSLDGIGTRSSTTTFTASSPFTCHPNRYSFYTNSSPQGGPLGWAMTWTPEARAGASAPGGGPASWFLGVPYAQLEKDGIQVKWEEGRLYPTLTVLPQGDTSITQDVSAAAAAAPAGPGLQQQHQHQEQQQHHHHHQQQQEQESSEPEVVLPDAHGYQLAGKGAQHGSAEGQLAEAQAVKAAVLRAVASWPQSLRRVVEATPAGLILQHSLHFRQVIAMQLQPWPPLSGLAETRPCRRCPLASGALVTHAS